MFGWWPEASSLLDVLDVVGQCREIVAETRDFYQLFAEIDEGRVGAVPAIKSSLTRSLENYGLISS